MKLRNYDLLTRMLRSRPLALAAVCFLAGCILGYVLAPELGLCAAALMVALLLACGLFAGKKRRIAAAFLVLAFLPAGALRFQAAWRETEQIEESDGVVLCGRIVEMPMWDAERERTICVLDEISIDGQAQDFRLRLYLRSGEDNFEALQEVKLAQHVECEAKLWAGDPAGNVGEFSFENYLRLEGLSGYATAKIETAQFTQRSPTAQDSLRILRARISEHIEALFPRNAGTVQAFLLGDRSGIDEDMRKAYSESGAAHLLAISGMHISILAMFLMLLLNCFLPRNYAYSVTLVLLIAYGMLIGFSASLTRSIIMYGILGFGPVAGRYSDAPTRLCAAMLLSLAIHPQGILESGFVLSYGATAGLILLTNPLSRLLGLERIYSANPGHGLKALLMRCARWILQSLVASLAAQIAILPAVVYYFGAQPLWSVLLNIFAVPLAMGAYVISILATVTGFGALALLGDGMFELLNTLVMFFGALPMTGLRAARFPLWLTLICVAACILASDICVLPARFRRFLPLVVVAAFPLSNLCAMMTTYGASVVFLDAGQADCAVLRTQGRVYLIDTGDSYSPAADYLSAMNYTPEGIFLSHLDSDHAGGLAEILEVCTPGRIYLSCHWANYEISEEVLTALGRAQDMGCEFGWLSAGDTFALSGKTFLKVLNPMAGFSPASANDDSVVLHISYCDTGMLFTGDAAAHYMPENLPDVDLLKVAHHGSARSLTEEFLLKTSPSLAVISVGADNSYGHPRQETLDFLGAAGVYVLRTDECGMITCKLLEDGGIEAQPFFSDGGYR